MVTNNMSFGNLGKTEVCFGEYKCSICKKEWQSCRAWADYGQQCNKCSNDVKPYHLEKLFQYICQTCGSGRNWKFVEDGLKCENCNSSTLMKPLDPQNVRDLIFIQAHRLEALQTADTSKINPSKEHRSDLCEKCQAMGRCCTGKGSFFVPKSARSTESKWLFPQKTTDDFPTPKLIVSSDSESD